MDKNIHPSFQRLDCSTRSLHYFHAYACLDRLDFSNLSDLSPSGIIDVRRACLPTESEVLEIKNILQILVSRYVIISVLYLKLQQ